MAKPINTTARNQNNNGNRKPSPATPASTRPSAPQPAAAGTNASSEALARPSMKVEVKPAAAEISNQMIAEAAYYLWLQRGGNETVNWLEAESTLRRKLVAR
jgi:hypothetical protein